MARSESRNPDSSRAMNSALRYALDRTLVLMRDEFVETTPDERLLFALAQTRVALVADAENLASHSGQTSYIAAALLMARSGHEVHLLAPDVPLVGPQPPLPPGCLVSSLVTVGGDLLPGVGFSVGSPFDEVDLEVRFGTSPPKVWARRSISIGATPWSGWLRETAPAIPWTRTQWPFGGMAAAALSAVEAFKSAMEKLRPLAINVEQFDARFAPTSAANFELAPASSPMPAELGRFDLISAGAITNAVLFALVRILGVAGLGRVIDDDIGDLSNLNRYALLLRSMVLDVKASTLAAMNLSGLDLTPVPIRYSRETAGSLRPLAARVLVGVDDIAARWEV